MCLSQVYDFYRLDKLKKKNLNKQAEMGTIFPNQKNEAWTGKGNYLMQAKNSNPYLSPKNPCS